MKNTITTKEKIYDLTVAWRIYPNISRTPFIKFENKFELVTICLKSFIDATKNLKIKYFFILDKCPVAYVDLINTLFVDLNLTIIETDGIGNELTFKKQIDILLEQDYSENIYFAEDDYLYLPDAFYKSLKLLSNKDVDFVCCYQHYDTFTTNLHAHKRDIKFFENQFWHTDSSTCLTFLTTKSTLEKTKGVFYTYCNGNFDVCIWLLITGTFIRNPLSYLKFYLKDKHSFWLLTKAFKNGFKFVFLLKKYKLWIPYPAICTHLEKEFISPSYNWEKLANSYRV